MSTFLSAAPVSLAYDDYLVNIMFDDHITNESSDFVGVTGSQSARVAQYGTNNKVFTAETGWIDNEITLFVPEYEKSDKYVVQFDIGFTGTPAETRIQFLNKDGVSFDAARIDEEGMLNAGDDSKEIGLVGDKLSTVSFVMNTDLSWYSAYFNGRERVNRKSIQTDMPEVVKIKISTAASGEEGSILLDNIRIYHGTSVIRRAAECSFNPEEVEYVPVDEKSGANKVYYKNTLDTPASFSMTNMAKTNEFRHMTEDKNGYIRFIKTKLEDMFFDISPGNTAKKVVIEFDLRYQKKMPELILIIRDYASTNQQQQAGLFSVTENGVTMSGASGKIKKNAWNRICAVMDFSKHLFDVYVNGIKIASEKNFPETMDVFSLVRFYVGGGTKFGEADVDNVAIYAGSEPRDITQVEVTKNSIFSDTAALNFLKGKKALQTYANTFFDSKEKSSINGKCINIGDESLIPEEAFEKLFSKNVTLSGDTVSIDGGVTMTVGNTDMNVNGSIIQMPEAPKVVDGVLYIPADVYGKNILGEGRYLNDDHGMLMVASGLLPEDSRYKEANQYLFFERKSADELKSQFMNHTEGGSIHPRIMLTEKKVVDLRYEIRNDPYKMKWFEKIRSQAESVINQEVITYKIDNGRLLDVANSTVARMLILGFTYQMTGDMRYAKRGIAELLAVCTFPDWHPTHYLDTGTMATGVAIGYDWLWEAMTNEERETIAKGAQEMGLGSAQLAYYGAADFGNWWTNTNTNWGVIVNGGIANLAMATAEYETDFCMEVLHEALRAIENTWWYFAPDGAWHEGPGYWSYLLQHLGYFMSSYDTSMGGWFGKDFRGLSRYGLFQAYLMGPDGISNSFHDTWPGNIQSDVQYLMANIYGDEELALWRRNQMDKYNIGPSVPDILWYDTALSKEQRQIDLPKDAYYRETEYASLRENWEKDDSAWVSWHGAKANNAHDHIDTGAFVFTIGGERWAMDLGSEPLSYVGNDANPSIIAGYGPYYFYRRKGEGHNVVVINPDENLEIIQNAFSKVSEPETGEFGAFGTIDMSAAYAARASKYIRGYKLSDSRRTLTIRDEIDLMGESELRWFMHTDGEIRVVDDSTAIIYKGGKALKVQAITNGKGKMSSMKAEPLPQSPKFNMTPNEGITKIDYQVKGSGHIDITVKMSLLDEIGSETGVDNTPISEWDASKIQPGRSYTYSNAKLSDIKIGGYTVTGFKSDKYAYTYTKGENGVLPVIEATAQNGEEVNVEYYKRTDGLDAAVIKVKDANNGLSTYYSVLFYEFSLDSLDVYNRYSISAIAASSEQVEPDIGTFNVKENSTDGNLETRWSANGTKEWIVYDLGEVKLIDAFAVAYWMGNQRKFKFELLASDDNKNFKEFMAVTTAGDTENPVVYRPDQPVKARYIKLAGHGSNTNEWNNVIEFMALVRK